MKKFIKAGVIGHPISHSKSPLIHNFWIKQYGLNGEYRAFDVAPADLKSALHKFRDEDYKGLNVTIPHKEAVMELCDELDDTAVGVKAVNTITFKKGKIIGANTDVFGFIENITSHFQAFGFRKGPAMVIGAGGAARAVIYGLLQKKVPEIRLVNRSIERAEALAKEFPNIVVHPWEKRSDILNEVLLLANTTSLGMKGQPPLDINLDSLNAKALVCDIVYNPHITPLILQAINTRHYWLGGHGMLLQQARPAFKKWFGVMPEIEDRLRKLVAE